MGGTIFINTPANNMMGHGFYQFSPELMYRIFSDENGFAIRNVLLYEARYPGLDLTKKHTVFKVMDPSEARQRVGLLNKKPVMMMVEAAKIRDVPMFTTPPQQSDYVVMWDGTDVARALHWRERVKQVMRSLPLPVRAPIQGFHQKRVFSLGNKSVYERQRW
ncbi:hypothetical protein, partial [Mycolicibacter algericus]|uniref:hypothetical protein n=1 Tax=Mycolicibacter algericus TaxID=1288388 RepID=UPI0021F3BB79